jgi:hypothetical protein
MPSAARLRVVRDRLLTLHKALLDGERARYEAVHGPVRTSGEMLQLVLGHEHFAWLRAYSGLIVRIDEWLASDEPTDDEADACWEDADHLTTPGTAGDDSPSGRYRSLIDEAPEAAAAHAAVRQALA